MDESPYPELYKKIEASRAEFERLESDEGKHPKYIERYNHNGEYALMQVHSDWCAWCGAIEYTHRLETDKITMPPINLLNIG